jgi:LemA protein
MDYIYGVIGIIILLLIIVVMNYNSLVKLRQRTKNAWSQIDVQLQKRYDLIPNLVDTVKAYAAHESSVLENISKLRTSWVNAQTIDEKSNADKQMSSALKTVMAVAENYPELKANENFIQLQTKLSDIESQVAFSRQFYNDTVTKYNTKIEQFPSNIFAKIFGFQETTLYQVETAQAKNSVSVEL